MLKSVMSATNDLSSAAAGAFCATSHWLMGIGSSQPITATADQSVGSEAPADADEYVICNSDLLDQKFTGLINTLLLKMKPKSSISLAQITKELGIILSQKESYPDFKYTEIFIELETILEKIESEEITQNEILTKLQDLFRTLIVNDYEIIFTIHYTEQKESLASTLSQWAFKLANSNPKSTFDITKMFFIVTYHQHNTPQVCYYELPDDLPQFINKPDPKYDEVKDLKFDSKVKVMPLPPDYDDRKMSPETEAMIKLEQTPEPKASYLSFFDTKVPQKKAYIVLREHGVLETITIPRLRNHMMKTTSEASDLIFTKDDSKLLPENRG